MGGRWKKLLGEATKAVEVVTFDYPCKMLQLGQPLRVWEAPFCRVEIDPLILKPLYLYV